MLIILSFQHSLCSNCVNMLQIFAGPVGSRNNLHTTRPGCIGNGRIGRMGAELRVAVVQLAPASHCDTVSSTASTCLSSVSIGTQTRSRHTPVQIGLTD